MATMPTVTVKVTVDDAMRAYLMTRRQTLLMELGAIEDLLGIERTKKPKHLGERVNL
jgi:hypothetical protein